MGLWPLSPESFPETPKSLLCGLYRRREPVDGKLRHDARSPRVDMDVGFSNRVPLRAL